MVPCFQGPCPKVISKPHKCFFFLRRLLLSDANMLSVKYQLNSVTGTMKILEQSICGFMQINTVSVLESNTYSWSCMRVSRADSNVPKYRTHTSRRTRGATVNVQATFSRSRAQAPLPSTPPGRYEGDYHQLEPFQVCPSLSPNTPLTEKQSPSFSF